MGYESAEQVQVWMIGDNPQSDIAGTYAHAHVLLAPLTLTLNLATRREWRSLAVSFGAHWCIPGRGRTACAHTHDYCRRRRAGSDCGAGARVGTQSARQVRCSNAIFSTIVVNEEKRKRLASER